MRWDPDTGEKVVCLWVYFLEDRSDVEAVDEKGLTACAVCVGEEVEELQAGRVGLLTQ